MPVNSCNHTTTVIPKHVVCRSMIKDISWHVWCMYMSGMKLHGVLKHRVTTFSYERSEGVVWKWRDVSESGLVCYWWSVAYSDDSPCDDAVCLLASYYNVSSVRALLPDTWRGWEKWCCVCLSPALVRDPCLPQTQFPSYPPRVQGLWRPTFHSNDSITCVS